MKITIAKSTGKASTKLGAFDAALFNAGIANYNLMYLSSVIPPNTIIQEVNRDGHIVEGEWGDKLYVVMAQQRQDTIGHEAWAGIGWVQEIESGKGLFVEHEGYSKKAVESDINNSLDSLMKTRGVDFGKVNMILQGSTCVNEPVCAMVVAVYQSEEWSR